MADLDLTVAPPFTDSTQRRQVANYTGPNPYVPGTGDVIDPEDVRMGKIFAVLGLVIAANGTLYGGVWDPSTNAIFWYLTTSGAEAGAVDLSSEIRIEIVGQ